MAIDQETFNTRLYSLLKTRGYKPVPRNVNNERTTPQDAEVFEFTFKKGDETYGLAWVTIDQASNLKVYYNGEQSNSPKGKTEGLAYDDSWSGFLRHLKQWAQSKQLSFELQDGDRPGDDMRQRETNKKKEKMAEGYHAVNKTTSFNDNIPNVKVVIQHDRQIGEGEQRWRNVHKIFVENTEGERFAVPTRMPGIARVYGRHVAEGGTPYDDRGKHITSLVEEYTQMAGFVRATRRGEFNESVALLIAEGVNHHKSLKESLQRMQSHRGYNHYFESWTPPLMEDDSDSSSIAEMFAQETIDPRIESVLPILNRLNSGIINEIEEVNELDQWARGITEITEAEGDKCEICNGRGKIDYHSEDGPSKCQKCNGKGVQAWKPEPVNWGNAKVKEDDLNDLRKRAGLEVRAVSEESLHEESFDCDDKFFETYGWLDADTLEEAEYQGRKVKLNKPMQGDVKKFKVYVKDPKTGNTKKVNFGHGGSSVKGKAMKIRKNNPKARKSFRARHNCDSPGPKTKARYWSCRKW